MKTITAIMIAMVMMATGCQATAKNGKLKSTHQGSGTPFALEFEMSNSFKFGVPYESQNYVEYGADIEIESTQSGTSNASE